ncbi:hypothetical protein KBZ14_07505 [Synechococcus sp. HJ21-Hayes]|jgi:hypothetical protein|uniref:hypothetical protein n=1 Tax=unclassified Synechococcus TaxID=2626047 RepID=UPI0020CDB1E9|nr:MULTISPECIES: hypothetical protein [unclassified Synechococcus]MCP9831408.1 hypothetical protein [Synechococcus sp. JJ3a-Johnson]MCP9852715.1 hypothetical protein [Synechococcus sp. HJ21-Hayes]
MPDASGRFSLDNRRVLISSAAAVLAPVGHAAYADLVLFLASDASNFICGQVIRLDGGLTAV